MWYIFTSLLIFEFTLFLFKRDTYLKCSSNNWYWYIISLGQQIQQDPNEPGKWQVVTVSSAATSSSTTSGGNGNASGGECEAIKQRASSPNSGNKRLLKRVACTCPNCDQGEKWVYICLLHAIKLLRHINFKMKNILISMCRKINMICKSKWVFK